MSTKDPEATGNTIAEIVHDKEKLMPSTTISYHQDRSRVMLFKEHAGVTAYSCYDSHNNSRA